MAGNAAADVRAGGAWYELWGKDNLSAVLDKAKKNAESFGGAMKKLGKSAGGKASDLAQGALKGMKGNIYAAVGEVATDVLQAVAPAITGLNALRKEWEKTARAMDQAMKLEDWNAARRGEKIEALIDPGEKQEALKKEIAKLEEERASWAQMRQAPKDQKKGLDALDPENSTKESFKAAGRATLLYISGKFGGLSREELEGQLNEQIKTADARVAQLHDKLMELGEQRGRLLHPDNDPAKQKAVRVLTRDLEQQAKMFGKSADEIKRYQMNLDGFSNDQIEAVKKAQDHLKRIETLSTAGFAIFGGASDKAKELTDHLKSVDDALKKQIDTWGMAADQITLYELKAKGFEDAQLGGVKEKLATINMREMLTGAAGAIATGLANTQFDSASAVGSFSGFAPQQQFGAQRTDARLKNIADNTAATVAALGGLAEGLKVKR